MREFSVVPSCVVDTDRTLAALVRVIGTLEGEIHDLKRANGAVRFNAWVPSENVSTWESEVESLRRQERQADRGASGRKARPKKSSHAETCPTCGRKP